MGVLNIFRILYGLDKRTLYHSKEKCSLEIVHTAAASYRAACCSDLDRLKMASADTWNGTDPEEELLPEPYDLEFHDYSTSIALLTFGVPLIVCFGLFLNILAVVVILKGRVWLGKGGRLYLVALLVINSTSLVLGTFTLWIGVLDHSLYIPSTSMAMCRFWPYLELVILSTTRWILPALLLEIYSPDFSAIPACGRVLAGNPTKRAKRLLGMAVLVAAIINLWFVVHPQHLVYNVDQKYCYYSPEWLEQNRLKLIAWRFFEPCLPLYLITPALFILIIHRKFIRGEFSFRLLENSDSEDGETPRELAVVSLGIAAVVFSCTLPTSISQLYNDLNPDHHSHTRWAVIYLLFEMPFVMVPTACFVLSASMRQFVKKRILSKCCVHLRCCSRPRSDDQIPFGDPDQSADGDDDPSANPQPQVCNVKADTDRGPFEKYNPIQPIVIQTETTKVIGLLDPTQRNTFDANQPTKVNMVA